MQMPDFSTNHVTVDDFDENDPLVPGVIGFVPVNPADIAALPQFRLHRIYYKRRYP